MSFGRAPQEDGRKTRYSITFLRELYDRTGGDGGVISVPHGGTGIASYSIGNLLYASASTTLSKLAIGASGRFLQSSGTVPQWTAPGALTKTDDTNITLTLGGAPTVALQAATSLTLGWTGTLAAARLNANVVQAVVNDTNVTGSIAVQTLTFGWTGTLAAARLNANVVQSVVNDTNVTGSIAAQALTLAWSGTLSVPRGGTGLSAGTSGGVPYYNASNTMASSAALGSTRVVLGGGAGAAPNTSANLTFDGTNLSSTGFSGPHNGTLGAGTPNTAVVTSLQADSIVNDTGLASDVYTPTLTAVTNVAATTAYECQYLRVGNTVTVSGKFDVDPTTAGLSTEVDISLPIASDFSVSGQCGGTAAGFTVVGESAAIFAEVANNRAGVIWVTSEAANHTMLFSFTYRVL